MKKGMLYVFTGDGKGKTSAALGVAIRMLLNNKRVAWISWYKSEEWEISEKKMANLFKEQLDMVWAGKGFYINDEAATKKGKVKMAKVNKAIVVDYETKNDHIQAAKQALNIMEQLLKEAALGKNKIELIVADEINQTVNDGLLTVKEITKVLDKQGSVHIVLTGRQCNKQIIDRSDLVTEMGKVKHPFDVGIMAVKGLDF